MNVTRRAIVRIGQISAVWIVVCWIALFRLADNSTSGIAFFWWFATIIAALSAIGLMSGIKSRRVGIPAAIILVNLIFFGAAYWLRSIPGVAGTIAQTGPSNSILFLGQWTPGILPGTRVSDYSYYPGFHIALAEIALMTGMDLGTVINLVVPILFSLSLTLVAVSLTGRLLSIPEAQTIAVALLGSYWFFYIESGWPSYEVGALVMLFSMLVLLVALPRTKSLGFVACLLVLLAGIAVTHHFIAFMSILLLVSYSFARGRRLPTEPSSRNLSGPSWSLVLIAAVLTSAWIAYVAVRLAVSYFRLVELLVSNWLSPEFLLLPSSVSGAPVGWNGPLPFLAVVSIGVSAVIYVSLILWGIGEWMSKNRSTYAPWAVFFAMIAAGVALVTILFSDANIPLRLSLLPALLLLPLASCPLARAMGKRVAKPDGSERTLRFKARPATKGAAVAIALFVLLLSTFAWGWVTRGDAFLTLVEPRYGDDPRLITGGYLAASEWILRNAPSNATILTNYKGQFYVDSYGLRVGVDKGWLLQGFCENPAGALAAISQLNASYVLLDSYWSWPQLNWVGERTSRGTVLTITDALVPAADLTCFESYPSTALVFSSGPVGIWAVG
jgi:hypothetical protein